MPAGNTYKSIFSETLTSSKNRIDFTSIPQNYTDLVLVVHAKSNVANDIEIRINDDAGANYSRTLMWARAGETSISRGTGISFMRISNYAYADPTHVASHSVHFFSYANTSIFKSAMNLGFSVNGIDHENHIWRSTAAISKLSIYCGVPGTNTFSAGSQFSLYGIEAA